MPFTRSNSALTTGGMSDYITFEAVTGTTVADQTDAIDLTLFDKVRVDLIVTPGSTETVTATLQESLNGTNWTSLSNSGSLVATATTSGTSAQSLRLNVDYSQESGLSKPRFIRVAVTESATTQSKTVQVVAFLNKSMNQ
jgi:hypothetical protein